MNNHRWRIVAMLMGYAAIGHFNRIGISVAGAEVFIPDLKIDPTRMGWVYTAFLVTYTIGMLPAGWMIDRIGSARALSLYGLAMGTFVICTGAIGWLTTSPHSVWICLLVIRGLAGICNAPLHPGAAHVVSDVMPIQRRATANGLITAGAVIGIACCYPAFGWLMDSLTWQWAFVASGLMLIAYSLAWQLLAMPSLPHTQSSAIRSRNSTTVDSPNESQSVWSVLIQRNLWLLALSYGAYGYFQYLFFYWMEYYFEHVLHIPKDEARWASFWIMLAMGAGMALGGRITDVACGKLGIMRGRRAVVMTGMGLAAVFGVIAVNVSGMLNVAICLSLAMAAAGIVEGVFWTSATDIGGRSRGLSGAFMNTGGNVGGLISPVLNPYMAAQIGWPASIAVACGISLFGGLVWFLIQPSSSDLSD